MSPWCVSTSVSQLSPNVCLQLSPCVWDINAEYTNNPDADTDKKIFDAVTNTMKKVKGAYSVGGLYSVRIQLDP
jgi:hypothetical protein